MSGHACFVVRAPGSWSLTGLSDDVPEPVDLSRVLDVVGPAREGAIASEPGTSSGSSDQRVVRPTWMWVGLVRAGGIEIEDVDGALRTLEPDDLRLLDRIGVDTTVADVVAAAGVANGVARLEEMARSGRVLTLSAGHEDAAGEPAPSVSAGGGAEAPVVAARGLVGRLRARLTGRGSRRATDGPGRDDRTAEVGQAANPEQIQVPDVDPTEREQHPAEGPSLIPVYAIWPIDVGPMLSLGMLTAAARHWEGGRLNAVFEIRRPETIESFLDDYAARPGPAVLLCSDYVWSLDANLAAAAAGRRISPELVVVHGGPSAPKYEGDAADFLESFSDVADVLVRGEGEVTLCELLDALVIDGALVKDERSLAGVQGITFRGGDGTAVRTDDRPRLADLDELPSPYLTGEFDGIPATAWHYCLSIETNRGCPYGCTFCDWGSATMSRIRKFSMERVVAEFEWAARLGVHTVTVTDANFGIMSRDVEFARRIADVVQRTGAPHSVSWTGAKNTTKHLVGIMDVLSGAGVTVSTSLSLQTTDPSTLEVLDRTNISTDHYVKLAADFRRRGYPLQGDLMLGLPGQTFESYRLDLQFMLDHEVLVRSWPVQLLPNSPMNDPAYRRRHAIQVDDSGLVTSTATFDEVARRQMWRFRTVDTITERMGVLRHVMRYLQWDHGIPATEVMQRLLSMADVEPDRFPSISWVIKYFDLFPTVAVGWATFYREVGSFIAEEYAIGPDDSGLTTVLAVQSALMPEPGRTFPDARPLQHDYVAYYRSATRSLYTSGRAGRPSAPLVDHAPAELVVRADPMGLCTVGIHPEGDPRSEVMQGDFHVGAAVANELDSDLMRVLPALTYYGIDTSPKWLPDADLAVGDGFDGDDEHEDGATVESVRVSLGPRR